jgi:hypothetical protein
MYSPALIGRRVGKVSTSALKESGFSGAEVPAPVKLEPPLKWSTRRAKPSLPPGPYEALNRHFVITPSTGETTVALGLTRAR